MLPQAWHVVELEIDDLHVVCLNELLDVLWAQEEFPPLLGYLGLFTELRLHASCEAPRSWLQGHVAPLAGPDADSVLHRHDENLAVPNVAGPCRLDDGLHYAFCGVVVHYQLQHHPGKHVDLVGLAAPADVHDALLGAATGHRDHGHAYDAMGGKSLLDLFQLLGPDYGLYLFHD